MLRQLVEGGIDNLHIRALYRLLHVGHFLRPLVDQENNDMHFRIILKNGFGGILEQGGFSCLRRGNNHASLTLSDRADQIHDTHGRASARPLQVDSLVRENRGHILEIPAVYIHGRGHSVDALYEQKCGKLLCLAFIPGISADNISRFQAKLPDL